MGRGVESISMYLYIYIHVTGYQAGLYDSLRQWCTVGNGTARCRQRVAFGLRPSAVLVAYNCRPRVYWPWQRQRPVEQGSRVSEVVHSSGSRPDFERCGCSMHARDSLNGTALRVSCMPCAMPGRRSAFLLYMQTGPNGLVTESARMGEYHGAFRIRVLQFASGAVHRGGRGPQPLETRGL